MIDILVILQCAYGKTRRRRKQLKKRRLWLKGLWRSHTGKRLNGMLPIKYNVRVINSTPEIGESVSACFEPDKEYIQKEIEDSAPRVILACGKIAQEGIKEVDDIPVIYAPHPAWRALTNEKIDEVRSKIIEVLGD